MNNKTSFVSSLKEFGLLVLILLIIPYISGVMYLNSTGKDRIMFIIFLCFSTFVLGMFLTMGVSFITLSLKFIFSLFRSRANKPDFNEEEEKLANKFHWAFPIVGLILFLLGSFFMKTNTLSQLLIILGGTGFGVLVALLVQKGHFDFRNWA